MRKENMLFVILPCAIVASFLLASCLGWNRVEKKRWLLFPHSLLCERRKEKAIIIGRRRTQLWRAVNRTERGKKSNP